MRISDRVNRFFIGGLLGLTVVLMISGSILLYRFFGHTAVSDIDRYIERLESSVMRTAAREIRQYSLLLQALRNIPPGSVSAPGELEKQLILLYDLYGPEGRIPYLISAVGYASPGDSTINLYREGSWKGRQYHHPDAGEEPDLVDRNERPFPGESEIVVLRDDQGELHTFLRFHIKEVSPYSLYLEADLPGFHRNYMKPAIEESLSGDSMEWVEFGGDDSTGEGFRLRHYRFRPLRVLLGLPAPGAADLILPVPYFPEGRKPYENLEERLNRSTEHPKETGPPDRLFRPGGSPFEGSLYALRIGSRSAPFYEKLEKDLARNWLFSQLILTGLGAALLILALQLRRLRKLRLQEREFVASMTHELRTPLTVIQSAADNLSSGIVPPERVEEYGGLVKGQVIRLGTMIEEILVFSSLESPARIRPEPVPVNLADIVAGLKETLTPAASGQGTDLHWDTNALPGRYSGEPEIIRMTLENLILNALRHGCGGKDGTVRITGRIRIPDTLVFTVEDDGRGIAPGEQKRVFEPFYRDRISRRDQVTGSGLGLFIARRKARMGGGNLNLESPYRRPDGRKLPGCRFTLTLPCRGIKGDKNAQNPDN